MPRDDDQQEEFERGDRHGWWEHLTQLAADGEQPVVVEDARGQRMVLVPESRYLELQEAERTGGRRATRVELTARELEVLRYAAAGHSAAETARRLGLAANTVAQHLAAVRRRFGVRSTAAAVVVARREQLID